MLTSKCGTVVVVDDDRETCEILAEALRRRGHAVTSFTSPEAALAHVGVELVDVMVSDVRMDGMDGVELCERARLSQPDMPVILITGQGTLDTAVRALRAEAFDLVMKPVDMSELGARISRAIELRGVKRELDRLERESTTATPMASFAGASAPMRRVYEMVRRVGGSDASVLIRGETGTGKELVARAIHNHSARRDGPFVAINCAAVPANLLESQLFGHTKGAFTDAREAHRGLFLDASGGTLFLDEIGELPMAMQAKLLRALQERLVRPIGSNQELPFDTRIVSATNRDLETEVAEKRFREDLYYRLNVVPIDLPPLRARGSDVIAIAAAILQKVAPHRAVTISSEANAKLLAYDWPGNVRELENVMERAVALSLRDEIGVGDLPEKVRAYTPQNVIISAEETSQLIRYAELEERYIKRVIHQLGGNKSRAAQVLGVDRRTLYRKMESYAKSK